MALAEPQAERNFQRHGWITFDRSVNIKEICWDLSSIRVSNLINSLGLIAAKGYQYDLLPTCDIDTSCTENKM